MNIKILKTRKGKVTVNTAEEACSSFGLTAGQRVKFLFGGIVTFEGVGIEPQLKGVRDRQIVDYFDYELSSPVLWFTEEGSNYSQYICPEKGVKYFEPI